MAGVAFGCRPCRAMRSRFFKDGLAALPPSWRKKWLVQRIVATPEWSDFSEIRAIYREAARREEATGIKHNVDHIVPLNHPRVCGLHVPANLQILTKLQNEAKSNYFCPEQIDLFSAPEQLRIF